MAKPAALVSALACTLLLASPTAYGQWIRGVGENLGADISSDYMYRFRVAVTPRRNLVYGIIGSSEVVAQFNMTPQIRGVQSPAWQTASIPGLSTAQPVLNVDSSTDRVYFIHPTDGKIYCYDASLGAAKPVWVSSFVCSPPSDTRNQSRQVFTANGKWLLARCGNSVVVVNERGALFKNFSSSSVRAWVAASDLAAAIPVFNNFTRMMTWFTNSSGTFMEAWALNSGPKSPPRPGATFRLPADVVPKGINTESVWWTVVADAARPVVHLISSFNGKRQWSFDFRPVVDPDGTADPSVQISVLATPVISNKTMYGVVEMYEPSLFPWMPSLYPEKYTWWMFALNISDPKAASLLWLTTQEATRGPLAPQIPWVTSRAVFITDYQQNGTRSFGKASGLPFYNIPANPYMNVQSAYSLMKGTYKISLPWVSQDGLFEVIQYDDWMYDRLPADERNGMPRGAIRSFYGLPLYAPPPPSFPPTRST